MEGNDISNQRAQKLVFVFDGLVGRIPEEDEKLAEKLRRKGKWRQLSRVYGVDTKMGAHLWDIVWRSPYSFDVVSFESESEEWYEALESLLERANVPYSRLETYANPDEFAQQMVYAPNIVRVYHANPSWAFKFGPRGEAITDSTVFALR